MNTSFLRQRRNGINWAEAIVSAPNPYQVQSAVEVADHLDAAASELSRDHSFLIERAIINVMADFNLSTEDAKARLQIVRNPQGRTTVRFDNTDMFEIAAVKFTDDEGLTRSMGFGLTSLSPLNQLKHP